MNTKIKPDNFHPYLFCPVFWHLMDALNDPNIIHIFIYGGSNASKTYSIVQLLAIEGYRQSFSSIIFRKEQASHEDTIENDLKEINERLQLDIHEIKLRYKYQAADGTNKLIRLRGIDKAGKVKGLKGFRVIDLDELDQFEYEDYRELRRRLRAIRGAKMMYQWNPVSEDHWIKKELDKETWTPIPKQIKGRKLSTLSQDSGKWVNERGDSILLKVNYKDNYFCVGHPKQPKDKRFGMIDKVALREIDYMRQFEPDEYEVYGKGNWGRIKTGKEYYDFEKSRNVKPCPVDPILPIHVSLDFNTNPYMAGSIWQVDQRTDPWELRKVKEYALEPPKSEVEFMCEAIYDDFQQYFKNGLFLYGDVHMNRSTMVRGSKTFLNVIIDQFKGYLHPSNVRVPKANPFHHERRRLINRVLRGGKHYRLYIDPSCSKSILDYEKVLLDANGAKLKQMVTVKKVRFEKYNHFSDGDDYFIHYMDGYYL